MPTGLGAEGARKFFVIFFNPGGQGLANHDTYGDNVFGEMKQTRRDKYSPPPPRHHHCPYNPRMAMQANIPNKIYLKALFAEAYNGG